MTAGATVERYEFELTLYVSGASDLSVHAIADARAMCDTHLEGRCRLNVVDVHDEPVDGSRVVATPTLVKTWPLPERKLVGDLSDAGRVLLALDLPLTTDASQGAGWTS
jgi:circadian clock protein KaiB